MIVRKTGKGKNFWIVPLSWIVAMLLTVIPYPDWMRFAVPQWVTLVLLYWCLAIPDRIGVGTGWLVGLVLDLLLHTLFGIHAVTKAFVAMVGVSVHRRMRMYPLWQQCIFVFFISATEIAFVSWMFQLTNDTPVHLVYWQAALTTALVWPVVYTILRFLRQRSRIS